jgi:hypothetical protein
MTWLTENWIWVLFGVAFVAMHFSGHGCHGGHGGHGTDKSKPGDSTGKPGASGSPRSRPFHRH